MTDKHVRDDEITDADARYALEAIRSAERTTAPPALHATVSAMADPRPRAAWRRPRPLALGGVAAFAAACVAALLLVLPVGTGVPTVTDTARVALAPASEAAPARHEGSNALAAAVDGVPFPYWSDATGWTAVGARRDVVDRRDVRTVFYADARGRRLGYAIAAGDPLPVEGGRRVTRGDVSLTVLRRDGANVVAWERGGRTCILASREVSAETLVGLASGTLS
jgi:hypothetical protein